MKPILFSKTATTFTSNGIGRLDPISCIVTEERNGMYELEMEIAETAEHASDIEMSSIIVAKPSQGGSNQPFRVYKITKPINGIFTVLAQHISYQLSFVPVMPFSVTASASACNQTLQALKTNVAESCPYTFWTNVTTISSYAQTVPASLRSRLGGVEGSVLDQFGGEYEWDGYTVKLWANRGLTTPAVSLRYGKNITDLNQEENIENTITGIVPYWQDSEGNTLVTLPEKTVDSSTASSYPFKRTVPYDFSSNFEEQPTEAQLRAKAQAYVNQNGIGIPKVSIKLSFVNLSETEEFKDIAALQQVNLCDVVGVYFEKLNISTTAKIVKTVYNVLLEKYDSVEIGSLRSTLASTITGQKQELNTLANNTKRMFAQYSNEIGELVDEATAWLTSGDGYVVATKDSDGNWKEMLFMDTNDIETATNVLRVNQNGIGFSSTGVAGPYTQAWTLDGHLVIGGTNVPSLTVYDNSTPPNILFQIDKDGMMWNAEYSAMTKDGVFSTIGYIGEDSYYKKYGQIKVEAGELKFYLIQENKNTLERTTEYVGSIQTQVYGQYMTPDIKIGSSMVEIASTDTDINLNSKETTNIMCDEQFYVNADTGIALYTAEDIELSCHYLNISTPDKLHTYAGITDTISFTDSNNDSHTVRITNGIITRWKVT